MLKWVKILSVCTHRCYGRHGVIMVLLNIVSTNLFFNLKHNVVSLPDATSCDNRNSKRKDIVKELTFLNCRIINF